MGTPAVPAAAAGGDGGAGSPWLGKGGDGGNAGNSGIGGAATALAALGGIGGKAGYLGQHGKLGKFGAGGLLQGSEGTLPALTTSGKWFVNDAGQVVILHGVNEVYKLDPYEVSVQGFGVDDAVFLAANGFNVVRLGVIWAAVEPEPGVYNTAYIGSLEQTLSANLG